MGSSSGSPGTTPSALRSVILSIADGSSMHADSTAASASRSCAHTIASTRSASPTISAIRELENHGVRAAMIAALEAARAAGLPHVASADDHALAVDALRGELA